MPFTRLLKRFIRNRERESASLIYGCFDFLISICFFHSFIFCKLTIPFSERKKNWMSWAECRDVCANWTDKTIPNHMRFCADSSNIAAQFCSGMIDFIDHLIFVMYIGSYIKKIISEYYHNKYIIFIWKQKPNIHINVKIVTQDNL